MENAILYAGVEELNIIKEQVLELNGYQEKNEELLREEARMEKLLAGKEKEMADEIDRTIKKRKNSIASNYGNQLSVLENRRKKVQTRKNKAKGIKVSERIGEETAELREANKNIAIDIKANMKKDKIPHYCNSNLFYSLFLPKRFGEYMLLMVVMILLLFLMPVGVYKLFFEKFGTWALAIVYAVDIVIFGGLYVLINNRIKEKHVTVLRENHILFLKIKSNRKKIQHIERDIQSDGDESSYGLEEFDDDLNEIDKEIQRVAEEEKEEMTKFEAVVAAQLKEEIQGRYKEEIQALSDKAKEVSAEQTAVEEKAKELVLMISKQYETYLGKDMLTIEKLDRLIAHIEKGEATNIGEAVNLEK